MKISVILLLLFSFPLVARQLIATSPQSTELLFELGKGKDIILTSQYADYPEAAKKIPRFGNFLTMNYEKIFVSGSDWLIFDHAFLTSDILVTLEKHRLKTLPLSLTSVRSLFEESCKLLKVIYSEPCPGTWSKEGVTPQIKKRPSYQFLLIASTEPTVLFGHNTFLSDILELWGGQNIVPKDWTMSYPQVSPEWLLTKKVDTLFVLKYAYQTKESIERWKNRFFQPSTKLELLDADAFSRATFATLKTASRYLQAKELSF